MSTDDNGHDWSSPAYVDAWVAEWSAKQERRAQLRRIAAALPFPRDGEITVLDLGCGWGPVAEALLAYRPHANVTLMDFSTPMLDHARTRLAADENRIRITQRDFSAPGWGEGWEGSFDAVVSCLAVHNLREPEKIQRVYREIRHLLRDTGCFVNLDLAFPAGPTLGAVECRIRAIDAGNDPEMCAPIPTAGADPRTVRNQLDWLHAAGFSEVDCLWRGASLAFLCASG
jgi:tRNA (cmo5U34)-methyltransferase